MSEFDTITVENIERIAIVTLNRPDSLNALNAKVMAEVVSAY